MRHEIIQTHSMHTTCETMLAERFIVHKLHEAEDRAAFVRELAPRIEVLAARGADRTLIEGLPKLKLIANFGVGYDAVDVAAAREHGVKVTNTPDVLNDAVAELTVGLMIAHARKIPQADAFVRSGAWASGGFPLQTQLAGKRLGIVGLGRIGKEIALRASAMKMTVGYFGRSRQDGVEFRFYPDLVDMAGQVDWLVVIAPGGRATDKLISRHVLRALGPKGVLVNMSRGSLVDEPAMIEALQSGALGGAVLDVFNDEPNVPEALRSMSNVTLSPHHGSGSWETRDAMGDLLVRNIEAYFAGAPLLTPVA